jgi:heme A synthase
VLPRIAANATVIEFTHRVMSGAALIAVVAQFAWTRILYLPGHAARRWAAWSLVFLLTEALLGASLVLLGHVASDNSVGRVYSLSAHLINTFALLASLTLTAWASSPGNQQIRTRTFAGWAPLLAIVAVAVSGAITALGDTLFPAHSLAQGLRDDFASTANFLIRLRVIHPLLAVVAGAFLAVWAGREFAARRTDRLRWLSATILALVASQIAVGAGNILLKAPLAMQLVHLLLADLVWITLVLLTAEWNRAATVHGDPGIRLE